MPEPSVQTSTLLLADADLPTRAGTLRCGAFEVGPGGPGHLALIAGELAQDDAGYLATTRDRRGHDL